AVLTLPALDTSAGARLTGDLWWDTEATYDVLCAEVSTDGGATWLPLPFSTRAPHGKQDVARSDGRVSGFNGRVWHRFAARLPASAATSVRWRYTTDARYVGRGVYVGAQKVASRDTLLYADARPADLARVTADGWTRERD
ncbi:immune inhibitor A, partial [Streptomyces sp. UH6]